MRVLILLPALLLAGCWSAQAPDNRAAGKPDGSPLDAEAQRESAAFWNMMLTRCGSSFYVAGYVSGRSKDGPHVRVAPDSYGSVAQLNGVSWKAVSSGLTQPDKLNGTDWTGVTQVRAKAIREKFAASDGFGLWRSPDGDVPGQPNTAYAVVLTHTHGSWLFNGLPLNAIHPVKIDCAHPETIAPEAED